MTPAWILGILAALMMAIAGVSAARLATARLRQRGPVVISIDLAHLLMAIAMAGNAGRQPHHCPGRRVGDHLRAADRLVRPDAG